MVEQPDHNKTVEGQQRGIDAEELSTKRFDSVRYASEYSGADGGEMIQNAIDDAEANLDHPIVVVGPEGPDNPTNSSTSQDWLASSTITIGTGTTLVLNNAKLFRADGLNDNLLRNKGLDTATPSNSTENPDITIWGRGDAVIHGNDANQSMGTTSDPPEVKANFYKVPDITIRGLKFISNNRWSIGIHDADGLTVKDIRYDRDGVTSGDDNDGIHLTGPINGGTVENLHGESNGDFTAVESTGNSTQSYSDAGGDVRGVTFRNIWQLADDGAGLFRTVASTSSTGPVIEDITLDGWWSNDGDGVRLGQNRAAGDARRQRNIVIKNGRHGAGGGCIKFYQSFTDLTIENVRLIGASRFLTTEGGSGDFAKGVGLRIRDCYIANSGGQSVGQIRFDRGTLNDVTISGCTMLADGGSSSFLRIHSDQTINRLHVRDCDIEGDGTTLKRGITIESTATISDLSFDDVTFTNVTNPWDDGNGNGVLGETLGVTRDGYGEEAVGASGTPTAAEWTTGDIVENTSPSPTEVYQLRPAGTWKQLA